VAALAEDRGHRLSAGSLHMEASMSTVFAKIIRGEAPADMVYQDDRVTCFRDINPAAPVHILIVPNKEIPTLNDLDEDDEGLAGYMLLVARRLAREEGIDENGYRLIINCNRDGGQIVDHLHLHLLGGRPMGPMVLRR
jgi:histidine triad (HIT) family protein